MPTILHQRNEGARFAPADLKAICFDLDGTLYDQTRLRKAMAFELLKAGCMKPFSTARNVRILREYRHAQEELRAGARTTRDIAHDQMQLCSERAGCDIDAARACVDLWFDRAPLRLLKRFVRPGAVEFLTQARQRGIRLALLSDYPAHGKLQAMGLDHLFDLVVSAQDGEVQAFKPNPAGLNYVMRALGVSSDQFLYVGDRVEVDAVAAQRAGTTAVVIGDRKPGPGDRWFSAVSFADLQEACRIS